MRDAALHILLLIALPPFLPGLIGKTKALFAGRVGPPLLQPWRDIVKLLRKGMVFSTTTTWAFRAGPLVSLAAVAIAGLIVPSFGPSAPLAFRGDFLLLASLLGLARFATTAAALDTGSAFEGMGASREVGFAVLAEPALFLAFMALARVSGGLSLSAMLGPSGHAAGTTASLVLVAIGLFIVILAETSRIPVDDPATHLELTMIHEVMVLDHSGPLLGLIHYAASLRLFVLGSVLIHVVAPFRTGATLPDLGLFVAETLLLAVAIGIVESIMARLRMRRVPYLLVAAILLCGSAFILILR